ncbi:putative bifunctional diguanylate cyclase/phosphodiesterase [Amycolatopsis anabasis]|uniref:putative bifunctional diguanylate cyclase/phosphodiesterase n=1 Tax=Amycolatopsis anabasis TaxID=1840409 RepID=UPI00131D960C|nr:EAL domain-containing protein [Amycolatopsis anabasis]
MSGLARKLSSSHCDPDAWRRRLVRKWAYQLSMSGYVPLSHAELEERLLGFVDRLRTTLGREPFSADPATQVGAELVALHCIGRTSLRCTVDVLGKNLLSAKELQRIDRLDERVVETLGALASGYTEALRQSVFAQQESVNGALAETVRLATASLKASEARFDELFTYSASGVAITDLDGRFLRVNEAFARIVDRPAEELPERTLFELVRPDEVTALRHDYQGVLRGEADLFPQLRHLMRAPDETVLASLTVSVLRDAGGRPERFVTVVEDDTEITLLRDRLSHQALHDMLTGLPNRQFFTTQLEKAVRHRAGITVYHLDLDAFSVITDGLGRPVGDRLLRTAAERITDVFAGENAMVARIGADEFGVVVANSPTTPDVVTMIGRINEALAEPVYVDGHGVSTSASVGVVHQPPVETGANELLRAADATLRRARAIGRRQWSLFDAGQDARDRETFGLAANMPGAWEDGEVRAVAQPVVRLSDDRIVGLEMVLRWEHDGLGVLGHDRCVELAGKTGLIIPLGMWLLRSACELAQDLGELTVSTALTPDQAHDPDLVGAVLRVLDETGLEPGRLRLGLPLAALAAERGEAVDNLKVLAEVGIGTMVDDFDGGPSELARLDDLPVGAVRFNRRAVTCQARGLGRRFGVDRAIVSVLATVREAGLLSVIDGVETATQAHWWHHSGANLALGPHYTTRPLPWS